MCMWYTNMRLSCLIFLAVISLLIVTECKPLSDDAEAAPCVDCKQKNVRRKRSYQFVFQKTIPSIKLNLGCLSCYHNMLHTHTASYTMTYKMSVNGRPDIYIGNGQNNVNHVVVNGANNVYIGNGHHNTNYVTYNG